MSFAKTQQNSRPSHSKVQICGFTVMYAVGRGHAGTLAANILAMRSVGDVVIARVGFNGHVRHRGHHNADRRNRHALDSLSVVHRIANKTATTRTSYVGALPAMFSAMRLASSEMWSLHAAASTITFDTARMTC